MPSYQHVPQSLTAKFPLTDDEELLDIPSHFDQALNGRRNSTFLSPNSKAQDASLLDPDSFRRLSVSTISSMGRARSVSPYPYDVVGDQILDKPRTWKGMFGSFWSQNQGLFLVTFSQLFGALMNATTRVLELEGKGMHPFQILFARQGLTALFCTLWMWWTQVEGFPLGKKGIRKLLVARACSGFFGIFGMYYSLQYLPVADAVVITFLAPSVASYGCYLFLKEPFPRSAQYASLISLLGVVLIARPTSFFTSSALPAIDIASTSNSTIPGTELGYPAPTSGQRLSAVGVAMIGVLGSAGAFTSIRWIGSRAHPLLSVNYFSVTCLIISTLALSLAKPLGLSKDLGFELPAGIRQWSMLLFLGVCGFVMQFLLTKGLASNGRGGGARATNMIYTNMLFALGLDKIVFGQSPGLWSLLGSGLILGSAVFVALKKGSAKVENGNVAVDEERGATQEEEMAMLGAHGEMLDEDAERAALTGHDQRHDEEAELPDYSTEGSDDATRGRGQDGVSHFYDSRSS